MSSLEEQEKRNRETRKKFEEGLGLGFIAGAVFMYIIVNVFG